MTGAVMDEMDLKPIGYVKNGVEDAPREEDWWAELVSEIIIDENLAEGLDEIEDFSHIIVLFWMHKVKSEQPPIKVRPMGRRDASPVGVFATRSPNRPNRIGKMTVRLLERKGNVLRVKGLDALDGAPVIDIKPYIPGYDSVEDTEVPDWITRR
jgi:tRNA-Thr(GGU) m(6)t(6)A37 methyltransferase TsaA